MSWRDTALTSDPNAKAEEPAWKRRALTEEPASPSAQAALDRIWSNPVPTSVAESRARDNAPLDRPNARPVYAATKGLGMGQSTVQTLLELPAEKAQRAVDAAALAVNPALANRPEASVGSVASGLGRAFSHSVLQKGVGIAQMGVDLAAPLLPDGVEQAATDQLSHLTAKSQDIVAATTPRFDSVLGDYAKAGDYVYGGAANVLQMIPGVAAAIATRNPMVGVADAAGETGVAAYGKYRARGATAGEAAIGAGGEAIAEGVGEMLPMGMLVDKFGRAGAKKWIADFLIQEMATEQATTLAQDAIDTAVANPDKTWGEYLKERPEAAAQTAVAVAMMGGVVGIANEGVRAGEKWADNRRIRDALRLSARTEAVSAFDPNRQEVGSTSFLGTSLDAIERARPVTTPGIREAAQARAATPTQEDIDSPLDTADIVGGRVTQADNAASQEADKALAGSGMPGVGKRVVLDYGDGTTEAGTMEDWFADETGEGVVVKLDNGKVRRNYRNDLADAGVTVREESPLAEADAIDAALAQRAEQAQQDAAGAVEPGYSPAPETQVQQGASPRRNGSPASGAPAVESFMAKTRRAESGGKDNAKNPNSSATGRYQFTDGTWLATYRQEFGNTGESEAQILAKRADGATQDRLMRRLTESNAASLRGAGLEVNEASLYLAHFAGSKGAQKLLTADPAASVESVLGQAAVNANPFLKGMTAADVVRWAAGKMGAQVAAAPTDAAASPTAEDEPAAGAADPDMLDPAAYVDMRRKDEEAEPERTPTPAPADEGPTAAQIAENATLRPDGLAAQVPEAVPVPAAENTLRGETIDREWTRFAPESGTLAIPRDEMPQISADNRGAMVNFLNARGIAHEEQTIPATDLKPTQAEFSEAKVQKAKDYEGGNRAILVSSDGYVLDGHHQWLAARDNGEDIRTIRLDAPIRDLINTVGDMPSTETAIGEDVPKVALAAEVRKGAETAEIPAPAARLEAMPSGKSIAVIGASEAETAAITAAVPKAKAITRKDGALVYSKKYEEEIRGALDKVAASSSPSRFGSDQSRLSPAQRGRADYAARLSMTPPSDLKGWQREEWRQGYMAANKESVLADRAQLIETTNAAMPEGYRIVDSQSGVSLVGPSGMVGGYLAPANSSYEVLQRAIATGKKKATTALAGARLADGVSQAAQDAPKSGTTVVAVSPLTPAERAELAGLRAQNEAGQEMSDEDTVRRIELTQKAKGGDATAQQSSSPSKNRGPVTQMPGKRTNKDYLTQGWNAAQQGFAIEDDPYYASSTASDQWRKGFRDGEKTTIQTSFDEKGNKLGPTVRVTEFDAIADYEDMGREAFAQGKERRLPSYVLADMAKDRRVGEAWYRGWDKANLAAPAPQPEAPPAAATPAYGAGNKVFTQDAAEKARALLRKKMSQLNSGFDPEVAQAGLTLMGYHIEAGARAFIDAARAVAADLGVSPVDLRNNLRSWYTSARNWFEDNGHDVRGMDDDAAVKVDLSRIEQWGANQATATENPATRISDAQLSDNLPQRNEGTGPGNVQRTAPIGSDGAASERQGGRGEADVSRPDAGSEDAAERSPGRPADRAGSERAGNANPDRVPAAERNAGQRAAADAVTGTDWTIEPGALAETRSFAQKARDNVDAIALVKQIEAEGRPATHAEQAVIARYVGWGGIKNIFPDSSGAYGKGFEELGPRLRELLSDEEYETARRSIQYAHYTGETVVRAMWDIAARLGFRGGSVFEPGMGTGNFRGMMPAHIAGASTYNGLEYDHLTASIAKLLYPQSGVRQADYTATPAIRDAFDLVIGNPPFSETVVSGDPEYGRLRFLLHDFFFAKSLDAVKPGGLLMFVTSAGTMNKRDARARQYLAERADLVGAIRLPGNTFEKNAGTSVTTDIIILRKRLPGEQPGREGWLSTDTVTLPDREGNPHQGAVNEYFTRHPEMVLGEQGFFDKLVAGPRYAVRAPEGFSLSDALAKAIDRLPANLTSTTPAIAARDTAPAIDLSGTEKKDGSYYIADGKLMQFRNGVGQPVQAPGKGVKGGMSAAAQERVRGLIPIKDALREVYSADLAEDGPKGEAARARLNTAYDAFTKKFGPINKTEISYRRPSRVEMEGLRAAAREEARLAGTEWEDGSFDVEPMLQAGESLARIAEAREIAREAAKALGRNWNEGTFDPQEVPDKVIEKRPNLDPFMDDEEGYRLAAIEHYNKETGEAAKGRAFYENAIKVDAPPQINSADDALLYSLNRLGRPDIGMIADMAGMSRNEVLEALGERLFEIPGKPDVYETAESYLSGNVREKLAVAREAAARNPAFSRNVSALEAAQPAPLTTSEISANLGMPWIPPKVIETFATERMGLQAAKVSYLPKLAQWTARGDSHSAASRSTWGTERMDAMALLEAALNRQTPTIRDRMEDGTSVINPVATQAAQDKMAEMKAAFRDWVYTDETRAGELIDLYNTKFNSLVAPRFDGTYLTTPGISSGWNWRPHQRAVVARIIQAGNTYMAHEVGAGKTSAMIGAGMEMKRLGLINKPMYVVPNHMLGQFTKEFYEQYPLARIRVADEQRFHTSRRKEFIARLAADDLDAVIITHSAFGFIPMSEEFQAGMIADQIAELEDLIAEIGKGQDERITRRKVEQQKEALEQRLRSFSNRKRDQVFTFEETGVDFLFVDEAHLFRKLDFSTKMGNVKGIDPNGSQMSFDLYAKSRYLESQRPGRSLVLASGTPITNTMAELYSVSRYLQQAELEKRGLAHFDAWAGAFGDTKTELEQDPAGGYKSVTRFSQFVNVPELSVMVRQVMDVVGAAELRQYVTLPTLKGGERQMVVADMTPSQEAYKAELQRRMEAIRRRSGPPKPGDDIILSVISDGRKAAIDYRLIDASARKEAGSKLELMIDNVARLHKEKARTAFHTPGPPSEGYSAKPAFHGPATQMIFSDFGINGDFPVHKYIKQSLVARGVPSSQVAIISDFKTAIAKQRLFNDMNEGKVRVLIGSVAKMGTGVNAQKRLAAIHNMDAQWYPANDTQRNGRGIRQGNMNPEIEIFDYSTQGTYDSTMWAMMGRKAKFIEAFMRGDPTMRDMEDLGEASQYEQAAAMTTSDPRIMSLTEWKQELEKLERQKVAHERDQQSIRARISYARGDKERAESTIPLIEQDIAKRNIPADDAFSAELNGKTYDDKGEYGEALMAALDKALDRAGGKALRENIGAFAGMPVLVDVHPSFDGMAGVYVIKRAGGRETVVKSGTDSRGLVTRMFNAVKRFEDELANERSVIARADQEIADYSSRLGATYDDGGKTRELREKIHALEATLDAETKAAEAAKAAAAQPVSDAKQSIPEPANLPLVATLTGKEVATATGMNTADLQARLESYGIARKVALRIVDSLDGAAGTFSDRLIQIATDTAQDGTFTLDHEVVHALRELGLFNNSEWAILSAKARRDTALMRSIKQRYEARFRASGMRDAALREALEEEAVADLFARYQRGDYKAEGTVARVFKALRQALEAIGNALAGRGARTAEGVMGDIAGGRMGERPSRIFWGGENTEPQASYETAPDGLMGFASDPSRQKGFAQNRYPVEQDVRVTFETGDSFEDTIEGLNGPHALERARRNWDGATIEAIGEPRRVAKQSIPERNDMVALGGSEPTWRGKMADAFDRWRGVTQDRYLPLLKVQREIEAQTGRPLSERFNPYLGEELMTGRIGARLERLAEDHVRPLFDAMHDEGVSIDELETFLYARHAPERNARIAEINPDFAEGEGSGMTDIEARAVMNRIRRAGRMEAMERLAARVDALRDLALDYRVKTGLMSQEQADEWRATYEHYVPLRGFREVEDGQPERINRSGGGINVRGRESRAAYGRRSKADSPLAYLIMQAEEAIVRGETNLVAQKFANLAKANPDPEFWQVNKVTQKRRMNPDTGLVEEYLNHNLEQRDADWTVSAKFDGKERRVTMNRANPAAARLADAMRNLTQHEMDWVTLHLGKLNRFLSAVNTSYNPEFVITNAFRDIQTATINLTGVDVDGIVSGTLRDYRSALVASTKGAFGNHSGEWGRWYDEFVDEGGRVYFNKVDDIGEIKQRIRSIADMAAARRGEGGAMLQAKRYALAARDMVENLNNGVENAVRLSVYKNARERGLSKAQAASLAKNITVNFNRRGTAGPALNAAYLFFNASMQGSTRIIQAMHSKRVRKMLAGVVVGGAMLELLNAMVSADDDDGEPIYDKIPAFEKGRNLIIMLPGGTDYVKIPLPYGYNMFWNAGRSVAEIARRGGDRWQETAGHFVSDMVDAFNPIGGAGSLLNMIAPTIADPIVDLTLNRDFTGKPIMPEQPPYDSPTPDNQRYWGSVAPHWRAITDFLSGATGGDKVVPGAIDVSPETLEYLAGTVMGAAGAFVDRMAGLGSKALDPDVDIVANDLPFARKVIGSKPQWYDKAAYYDRLKQIDQAIDDAKGYVEAGDIEGGRAYVRQNSRVLDLEADAKEARRFMRQIRKDKRENERLHERGEIDNATYRAEKALIDAGERAVIQRFNRRWNEAMLPAE